MHFFLQQRRYPFVMRIVAGLFFLLFSAVTAAGTGGRVHLLFHVGQWMGGHITVGGTLENRGDTPVQEGYVVVVPLDARCYPGRPVLQSFGPLSPGEKTGFSVPVNGDVGGYRLVSVMALDDMGYPLAVVDDTASVIASREPAERQVCLKARRP